MALGLAVPLMFVFWGARVSWHLLWVIVVLLGFVGVSLALALWLSIIGVFFRDTRDILEVGLPLLFWATPIFYDTQMAPEFLRPVLRLNPLSPFIEAARAALLDARAPSWGEFGLMAFWLSFTVITGVWVFTRFAPRFAEEA